MFKSQLSMFNLPNLFTAANMLSGIASILLSLSGHLELAPYPIFLGLIFDYLDGFLARILKKQSELGKQLDSLADMITFGLAPGIMMMVLLTYAVHIQVFPDDLMIKVIPFQLKIICDDWLINAVHFQNVSYLPLAGLFISLMSMFRLAKFNIDTRQSESFIGLPTPANTIFFLSFPLLLFSEFPENSWQQDFVLKLMNPYILLPIIFVMSSLLISEIPLFSLKFKHYKWKGNEIKYIFLITCSLLIPFCLIWSIPIIVILYLILSVIEMLLKKSKS